MSVSGQNNATSNVISLMDHSPLVANEGELKDAVSELVIEKLDDIDAKTSDLDDEAEGYKAFAHEQVAVLRCTYSEKAVCEMLASLRRESMTYVMEMETGEPVDDDVLSLYVDRLDGDIAQCGTPEACLSMLIADVVANTDDLESENSGFRNLCIMLGDYMDIAMVVLAYSQSWDGQHEGNDDEEE